jgi:hypothetical protein
MALPTITRAATKTLNNFIFCLLNVNLVYRPFPLPQWGGPAKL